MKSKKTLSILLAAMLVASMGTSAFADEKTAFDKITVSATMKVETPVISFDVPTGADIALDSYQLADETGSQIYSASYGIMNMSNIPIRAVVKPQIKIGTGVTDVTVVGTAAEAKPTNAEDQDKKVYMQITPSDKIETTLATDADNPTKPADGDTPGEAALKQKEYAKGAYTASSTAKAVVSTQANGNITFALAPANLVENSSKDLIFSSLGAESTTIKGAGQFRFMGTLNPNVTYTDGDIGVDIVFDVAGLTKDDYATLSAKPVANAANVASITNGTFGPFIKDEQATIDALTPSTGTFDLNIDLGAGKDAATNVTAVKAGTATLAKTTDWTFDADTGVLTFTAAGAPKTKGATVTITMDKGNPKTLTVTLPNA